MTEIVEYKEFLASCIKAPIEEVIRDYYECNKELRTDLESIMIELNRYLHEGDETQEVCPNCAVEVTIKTDGKSTCPDCGHKEVLPCSMCRLMDEFKCDWNESTRCTAFPKEVD